MSEQKQPGTIVDDAETVAMAKILKLLAGLDADARQRVMAYLNSRFQQEKANG